MNITDYGFFTVKEPESGNVILLFVNEDGEDWYDIRATLTNWTVNGVFIDAILPAWAMCDAEGVVTNVEYDPSRLMPGDRRVLGIDASLDEIKPGMIYRDGALHEHDPA